VIFVLRNIHPRRSSFTRLEIIAVAACALLSLAYIAILFCPDHCINKLLTLVDFSRIVSP
jgi:hypothetical protein